MTKYERTTAYSSILLLACLSVVILLFIINKPSDNLVVTFFDVGQGDSIYIKSPSGLEMLIDTGADKTILSRLGRQMSAFDRSLDVLLITHPDKDHIGGAPSVLSKYSVSLFIDSGSVNKNGVYEEVEEIVKKNIKSGMKKQQAFSGQKIDLGAGVVFTILFPERDVSNLDPNDASIVGLLTYGQHSILLTGDSGVMTERNIMSRLPNDITVLKVGHHGSDSSTSIELLEKTTPEAAILSLGANNSYGHPNKKVIDLLNQFRVQTYRTDESGSISFISNGQSFEIKTNR